MQKKSTLEFCKYIHLVQKFVLSQQTYLFGCSWFNLRDKHIYINLNEHQLQAKPNFISVVLSRYLLRCIWNIYPSGKVMTCAAVNWSPDHSCNSFEIFWIALLNFFPAVVHVSAILIFCSMSYPVSVRHYLTVWSLTHHPSLFKWCHLC